jgi:hypothetical protein
VLEERVAWMQKENDRVQADLTATHKALDTANRDLEAARQKQTQLAGELEALQKEAQPSPEALLESGNAGAAAWGRTFADTYRGIGLEACSLREGVAPGTKGTLAVNWNGKSYNIAFEAWYRHGKWEFPAVEKVGAQLQAAARSGGGGAVTPAAPATFNANAPSSGLGTGGSQPMQLKPEAEPAASQPSGSSNTGPAADKEVRVQF